MALKLGDIKRNVRGVEKRSAISDPIKPNKQLLGNLDFRGWNTEQLEAWKSFAYENKNSSVLGPPFYMPLPYFRVNTEADKEIATCSTRPIQSTGAVLMCFLHSVSAPCTIQISAGVWSSHLTSKLVIYC